MKWTKEKPTKPGFYFVRYTRSQTGVFLMSESSLPTPQRGISMAVNRTGIFKVFYPCYEPVYFAGPIPMPEGDVE